MNSKGISVSGFAGDKSGKRRIFGNGKTPENSKVLLSAEVEMENQYKNRLHNNLVDSVVHEVERNKE